MQMPDVHSSMKDEANNFVYHVLAFRKLDRLEMLQAISMYRSQPKVRRRRRPPQNGSVTIFTIHGATPDL
jgi:hypothetical protein